jgi:hypothetical protein
VKWSSVGLRTVNKGSRRDDYGQGKAMANETFSYHGGGRVIAVFIMVLEQ